MLAAEPLHTVTNHVADDPEGILGSICSAVGTSANNNAASSGHCHAYNLFSEISFNGRYGKIYNRNLPK